MAELKVFIANIIKLEFLTAKNLNDAKLCKL